MADLPKYSFDFLKEVKKNNNRDWFHANKDKYLTAHQGLIDFADGILLELNKHDDIETISGKKSLFRIYRDVRFSKDKTPYNIHWSGGFRRATSKLRGGYYFRIEPGKSVVAGGFWGPNPRDLKRIREEIDFNGDGFRKVVNQKKLLAAFGGVTGDGVKTAPKGYSKDHPNIDLLRKKQFIMVKSFTDKEVLAENYYKKISETFKEMRPFFDFMSDLLTTDSNGVSIIE